MARRKHFILAIDGGGIRGLLPLRILETLEARLRTQGKTAPFHRYFDLVAGTSTGALIAAGMAAPKPDDRNGAPAATIEDLRRFFEVDAREAFRRRGLLARLVANPSAPFDERYDARPLERLLKERFGWTSIASALTRLVMPAYDIEARTPVIMSNGRESDGGRPEDFYVWQAVRAAMATPTLFEPVRAERIGGAGGERVLVDGGLFMNNPVIAAYLEARKLGWEAEDMVIVSLGAGSELAPRFTYPQAAAWGPLGWLSAKNGVPLVAMASHGQSATTAYAAERVLAEAGVASVLRLDGALPEGADDLDNTRPGNIIELNGAADRIIRDNTSALDRLAEGMSERED
ncbi:patatin-like phospholipase family protein [Stappia sp. ES.058]|uniref:patatin-like phospholipase family protein n=1 Tax=Stappia sp. ES.058 TaxID=1881061 RepID=UPI00087DBEDF|nr:patatin-like phospholipase family protein [Stappia sp. ES.058]SDT88225.1 Patatin-like phospholipase [Stappia sp. ES.058]